MTKIPLLDADPDLRAGVPPEQLGLARRNVEVEEVQIEPGPWDWSAVSGDCVGMLVLEGFLTRDVTLSGVESRELLGAGDVLLPWVDGDHLHPLPSDAQWTVLSPARIVVLENRVLRIGARWPGLVEQILRRSIHRSRWLAVRLAIASVNRIDRRLLLFFWHAAGRWGRVTPDGTAVRIPLTHEDLAALVGARRPSVTTALAKLRDDGLVSREDDDWILAGEPPAVAEP